MRLKFFRLLGFFLIIIVFTCFFAGKFLQQDKRNPEECRHRANCEPEIVLKPGSPPVSSVEIEELQLGLKNLGFYEGDLTGVYDEKTINAVKRLQNSNGLKNDGIVDQKVWSLLAQSCSEPVSQNEKKLIPDKIKGKVTIVIDLQTNTLILYADGEELKRYPVATGTSKTPSPIGEWKIVDKGVGWGGGFGTRWLGLNVPWGIYGIHGTNKPYSIGQRMSHGCIRMLNRHVEELYRIVPLGTPVKIIGKIPLLAKPRNTMHKGISGRDVVYLQLRLAERGFNPQGADGRFGAGTERAVKELQHYYGLVEDGIVDYNIYVILGLR